MPVMTLVVIFNVLLTAEPHKKNAVTIFQHEQYNLAFFRDSNVTALLKPKSFSIIS